jgi:hypothetical protein
MRRTTLLLLALALAMGAYVYFGEVQGDARREQAEKVARRLVAIEEAELASIELPTSDGGRAKLARSDSGWKLVEPLEFAVDPFAQERLTRALAELESKSELEPQAELAVYGLDETAKRINASPRQGEPVELRIGKDAPVGGVRYVQVSSRPGKIFTVDVSAVGAFDTTLLDLRDKRLAKGEGDDATKLIVRFPAEAKTFELAKEGGDWKLVQPIGASADGERVRRLIDDLSLARATALVDAPGAPAEYGLEPPTAEVEIGSAKGSEQIALGKQGDKAYARIPGVESVLEVATRIVDGIPREVFEYRHKRVLTLASDEVKSLELSFPRENARQVLQRDEHTWKSGDPGLEVESLEVADLLFAIESLDATGIEEGPPDVARLGLEPPRVRVTARSAAGKELGWLELGDPDPEKGIAARSSAGPELWRVENKLGEDVPLGLDAFRNSLVKRPAEPATEATPAPPETPTPSSSTAPTP